MKVIEVDQFTSSGMQYWDPLLKKMLSRGFYFDSFDINDVTEGDAKAAKVIFGGHFKVKEVMENASPSIGYVWYIRGKEGFCEFWKANYDSSG